MWKLTKFQEYLWQAEFRTNKDAYIALGISRTMFYRIYNNKIELKTERSYATITHVVKRLNEILKKRLKIVDVFPSLGKIEKIIPNDDRKKWTKKEDEFLRENINKYSRKRMAELLDKKESQVRGYCYFHNIKKNKNIKNKTVIKSSLKEIAHRMVSEALRKGKLKRKNCELCNSKFTDAHHKNYNKPLDIVWLCRRCHIYIHKLLKSK